MKKIILLASVLVITGFTLVHVQRQKYDEIALRDAVSLNDRLECALTQAINAGAENKLQILRLESTLNVLTNQVAALK